MPDDAQSMLERFTGARGRQRLIEALKRQTLLSSDHSAAVAVAEKVQLIELSPSSLTPALITQGEADNDIYFIISGSVSILINGREIAHRQTNTHIGEMALIDPTARRSATVLVAESSVFAKISEEDFSAIADLHPHIWRSIAVELAGRLRERSRFIRTVHNQPLLFVGSSSEQIQIAREIQLGLSRDPIVVQVWTDRVFVASQTSIESLFNEVSQADFAVLIVAPDDIIESRGSQSYAPRDNVVFELGLFMSGIGRDRSYIAKPRGIDLKLPTDLLGITPLEYQTGDSSTLSTRIAPLCTEIRHLILSKGPK